MDYLIEELLKVRAQTRDPRIVRRIDRAFEASDRRRLARLLRGLRPPGPPKTKCPACGMVSYNPNDAIHRYCGYCHRFHG